MPHNYLQKYFTIQLLSFVRMKNIYIFLVIGLLALGSCGGKTNALYSNVYSKGKVKITITGKRATSIEAWKVEMKVKAYDFKEGKLAFEIYADDLNAETVSITWKDKHHAEIQFKLQDHTTRKFELIASPEQLQMGEI